MGEQCSPGRESKPSRNRRQLASVGPAPVSEEEWRRRTGRSDGRGTRARPAAVARRSSGSQLRCNTPVAPNALACASFPWMDARMLTPCPVRGPRLPTDEAAARTEGRQLFNGRHDHTGSRRRDPEPCSRPEDRPRRSGAMVRRVGAVCPAAGRGSESLFLGRRPGMDRRSTCHGHGRFFTEATAVPPSEEVQRRGPARRGDACVRLAQAVGDSGF